MTSVFGYSSTAGGASTIINKYYTTLPKDDDGNYDFQDVKITNVTNPTLDQDVVTLAYYQANDQMREIATDSQIATGTNDLTAVSPLGFKTYRDTDLMALDTDFSAHTHKITDVTDPTSNQDAATKKYVDDNTADGISYSSGTLTIDGDAATSDLITLKTNFGVDTLNNLGILSNMPDSISGIFNIGIGTLGCSNITTGDYNVAMGWHAADDITTGKFNTAIGYDACGNVITSNYNIGIGCSALANVSTQASCVGIGYYTNGGMHTASGVHSAGFSTMVGNYAGAHGTGDYSTGVGFSSLLGLSGQYNIHLGVGDTRSAENQSPRFDRCICVGPYTDSLVNKTGDIIIDSGLSARDETRIPLISGNSDDAVLTINGDLTVNDLVCGELTINDGLILAPAVTIPGITMGGVLTMGAHNITSTANITTTADITGDVITTRLVSATGDITTTADITGDVITTRLVNATGDITTTADVIADIATTRLLNATGLTSLATLAVNSTSTLSAVSAVSLGVSATSALTTLTVSGDSTLHDTTVSGDLVVTGDTTLTNPTFNGLIDYSFKDNCVYFNDFTKTMIWRYYGSDATEDSLITAFGLYCHRDDSGCYITDDGDGYLYISAKWDAKSTSVYGNSIADCTQLTTFETRISCVDREGDGGSLIRFGFLSGSTYLVGTTIVAELEYKAIPTIRLGVKVLDAWSTTETGNSMLHTGPEGGTYANFKSYKITFLKTGTDLYSINLWSRLLDTAVWTPLLNMTNVSITSMASLKPMIHVVGRRETGYVINNGRCCAAVDYIKMNGKRIAAQTGTGI